MTLKRILYVEDEPDIQQIVRLSLESVGGFTVELASNLSDALSIAPAFAPELILLDYMLPGTDGATSLQALRSTPALKDVPVIFVTARVQPQEVEGYRKLGALGVIPKPFDPMTLAKMVGDLWQNQGAASPKVRERLDAMRPAFAAELKTKMARLEEARSNLVAFHKGVHALTGSAGTFGFSGVSRAAGELEIHLKSILDRDGVPTPSEKKRTDGLYDALKRECERDGTDSPK